MSDPTAPSEGARPPTADEQLCPLLTIADSIRGLTVLVAGAANQRADGEPLAAPPAQAVPCQTIRCGFFLTLTDREGRIVGGSCSFVALGSLMSQHASDLHRLLQTTVTKSILAG